jgi:hypothetical protein
VAEIYRPLEDLDSRGSAGWIQIKVKILLKAKMRRLNPEGCGKDSEIPLKLVEAKRKFIRL